MTDDWFARQQPREIILVVVSLGHFKILMV
jgi:hypothetical protein